MSATGDRKQRYILGALASVISGSPAECLKEYRETLNSLQSNFVLKVENTRCDPKVLRQLL
jgi:hypothetical protein